MEDPFDQHDYSRVIMSNQEAEQYCGAYWRKPTTEELDELAFFFATDLVNTEMRMKGEEPDSIEYLIELNKEKEKTNDELQALTMVLDLPKLDTQVFYTYSLMFSATQKTNCLSFEEGMCKVLKREGKLKSINNQDDVLFDF
ncbi:hypothetical protein [Pedobacter sp. L105]|uniref:hypothetical protein n=1 Tax=Pedobacter sp. L105 TaxID=1641871 RepID=UPI00131C004B|nr:hypothetical protein [Pedobacter sp. L105]